MFQVVSDLYKCIKIVKSLVIALKFEVKRAFEVEEHICPVLSKFE